MPRKRRRESEMNLKEHLMVHAMEECNELAHRISKALRFGLDQIQQDANDKPEQNPDRLTNMDRIMFEYYDLRATLGMIGIDAWDMSERAREAERVKILRISKYLDR